MRRKLALRWIDAEVAPQPLITLELELDIPGAGARAREPAWDILVVW